MEKQMQNNFDDDAESGGGAESALGAPPGAIAPLERITSDKALQMRTLNVVRAHACTTAPKGRRGHLRHDR